MPDEPAPPPGTGEDLQAVVDDLASRIGRSVAVDDAELRLLAHSAHVGDEDEARLQSLLNRRVSPERVAWSREVGVLSATEPFHTPSDEALGIRTRFIVPLRIDRELLAIVWIIDDGSLDETARALVLEASARMRTILARRTIAAEDARRREATLVHTLLGPVAGRSAAARELRDRGTFPRADRFFVLAPHLPAEVVAAEPMVPIRAAERALTHRVDGIVALTDLVLVGTSRGWSADELRDLGEAVIRELRVFDAGVASAAVIGIGGPVGLETVVNSAAQASVAHRVAATAAAGSGERVAAARVAAAPVAVWGENGVDDLLAAVLPGALDPALVPPAVGETLTAQPAEVLEAVRVFLAEAGNAARTGARLHLHRTSVYYRLSRFQETTGLDLEDGSVRFLLQLWFATERYARG